MPTKRRDDAEGVPPEVFTKKDRQSAREKQFTVGERVAIAAIISFFYVVFGLSTAFVLGPAGGMIAGGLIAAFLGYTFGSLVV